MTNVAFTALIVIPHALIFPGAFTRTGLFHAGLQSSAWLYTFWHAGLPLAVIAYVLLRDTDSATSMSEHSLIAVIGLSVAVVIGTVCGLTWIATAGDWLLPSPSQGSRRRMRHFWSQDGTERLYEGLEWQGMLGQLKNHRKATNATCISRT